MALGNLDSIDSAFRQRTGIKDKPEPKAKKSRSKKDKDSDVVVDEPATE